MTVSSTKTLLPLKIKSVLGREVLDSRGLPTIEVELVGSTGSSDFRERAMVPSGASTGDAEALELRDGDKKRFHGKGVLAAVGNVSKNIASAIVGRDFANVPILDDALRELDGTPNKSKLGANAILGVSMAFCRAHARANSLELRQYLGGLMGSAGQTLPVPLMNVINGGKHADNKLAIQEFMIVPSGLGSFPEALRAGAEVFHTLKDILHKRGLSTGVGDEGGFAPNIPGLSPHEEALKLLVEAIKEAGYEPRRDMWIALDCAASEFCETGGARSVYSFEGKKLSSTEMLSVYQTWTERYPICSIEDGFGEHDWTGWAQATAALGDRCQLVGDDLYATNAKLLEQGISKKASNAILIKLNQIGTVTETIETMRLARANGMRTIVSHRSGETEDTFIADLAVGSDAGQIKTGSLCRSERIAKYNQLLRHHEALGPQAQYASRTLFTAP